MFQYCRNNIIYINLIYNLISVIYTSSSFTGTCFQIFIYCGLRELSTITIGGGGGEIEGGIEILWRTWEPTTFLKIQREMQKHFELFYIKYKCQCYDMTMQGGGRLNLFDQFEGESQYFSTFKEGYDNCYHYGIFQPPSLPNNNC